MKIAVPGSAGGNGRLILNEAVRRGYGVAGFARQADALAGAGARPVLPGVSPVAQHIVPALARRRGREPEVSNG